MLQSFFTGLSGLFSFSRNLDTVSNNIANMNTPGYRGGDVFYKSLSYGNSGGYGTQVGNTSYRFEAGDISQTSSNTDLAISGQGYFVLMQNDGLLYTRAGQFEFNADGLLVDKTTDAEVAALSDSGQLGAFDISGHRALAPIATSSVALSGNLSSGATEHEISNVSVFNSLGEQVDLTLEFKKVAGHDDRWNVTVKDEDGTELSTQEMRFGSNGSPAAGFNEFSFSLEDSLGGSSDIKISLGNPGGFSGATSTDGGTTSTLVANAEDGSSISALSSIQFLADGKVEFRYANGETREGPQLAIAKFNDESGLELKQGAAFSAAESAGRTLSKAGQNGAGTVLGKSIELSNVDLSKEFADMLIIQRGYQASSRILNVANQLMEQLYDNTGGR